MFNNHDNYGVCLSFMCWSYMSRCNGQRLEDIDFSNLNLNLFLLNVPHWLRLFFINEDFKDEYISVPW